jgi:glycosyltransferase involved in cell wall biosynthesis
MKILHINTYYDLKGGAEKYVRILCKWQNRNGNKARIIGLRINEKKGLEETVLGLSVNKNLSYKNFIFDLYEFTAIRYYIKQLSPDIIHLHNLNFFSWMTLLYLIFLKISKIQTIHDYGIYCPYVWAINNGRECTKAGFLKCLYRCLLEQKNVSLFDYLNFYVRKAILKNRYIHVVPTKTLANIMRQNGFKKINVICHGVEIPNLPITPVPRNFKILYLGRLSKEKGVNILVEAFSILAKKFNTAILEIVGDGAERENLISIIKEKTLENSVRFIGFTDNVQKYYLDASAVVVPSVCVENASLVMLEAMSYGRPVIVSDIGGLGEAIIDGVNGYKFKPHDHRSLVSKIEIVWKNQELTNKIVLNARKNAEFEYNIAIHIEKLNMLYDKIRRNDHFKKQKRQNINRSYD